MWQHPDRFDATRGPLRAYLLAMTHSRAVERVRAEDSLRRRHENASREALREPPVEDPELLLVDKDVSAAVRTALAALPESQRVPIEMAYFEGMSYRQVARRTGRAGRHREVPHPLRDAEVAHGVAGSRGRAMSYPNDEAEDRVIARALDAEEADEAAMDRATLDEYRRVLAHLPFEEVAPPAALEHRVFEAALASRPAAVPSIAGRAAKRRATARWVTLGAAVTAAAAAVITFMFTTSGDSGRSRRTRRAHARASAPPTSSSTSPARRTATLTSEGVQGATQEIGKVALAPDGEGVLYDLQLADAPARARSSGSGSSPTTSSCRSAPIADPTTETVPFKVTGDERHGRRRRDVDRDQRRAAGRTRPRRRPRHLLSDCAPAHSPTTGVRIDRESPCRRAGRVAGVARHQMVGRSA